MEKDYREHCSRQIVLLKSMVEVFKEIDDCWNKDENIAKVYEKGGIYHNEYCDIMKDLKDWAEYRIQDFKKEITISNLLHTIRKSDNIFKDYDDIKMIEIIKECLEETKKEYEEEIKNGSWR